MSIEHLPLEVKPLVNEHCATGENPYWNPNDGCVYWTDIPNGKIFRFDPATGQHQKIYEDVPVGGFTLQDDGNWLLFRVNDIAHMTPDGVVTPGRDYTDDGMERFNDVIADPAGRVYAGTIGTSRESGGLYRVDLDGTVTKLFAGTGCSNGMGFTPDRQHFYWTCSTTKRILRFAYNQGTGELSESTPFFVATENDKTPDGLAVDREGTIWSARYGGHGIVRHDANSGAPTGKIEMPVPNITSLFFGGAQRDIMYVTTAGGKAGSDTADGTLYQIAAPVAGQQEFVSRVRFA
ncbi:MAG TPA: SMP-30/gluconolactonase/LRE family protein [Abditibacteriaceae bacterium]|jgi:D-xylonolactonase